MSLDDLFLRHDADKSSRVHDYAVAYERYIDPADVRDLLEIGVASGASLRAWREWCPDARIYGVDLNGVDLVDGCHLYRGDITDPALVAIMGEFDVVIDDGSHDANEILIAMNHLWPHLRDGGWYVVEDLWPSGLHGGVPLFLKADAGQVHRHDEIVFARKGPA